jgi:hypothetical protein
VALAAGAEVPLGGLDAGMVQQELDLLEIATPAAAELGAGSSQIVRPQPQLLSVEHCYGEDRLGAQRVAGDLPVAVERQDHPLGNAGGTTSPARPPA